MKGTDAQSRCFGSPEVKTNTLTHAFTQMCTYLYLPPHAGFQKLISEWLGNIKNTKSKFRPFVTTQNGVRFIKISQANNGLGVFLLTSSTSIVSYWPPLEQRDYFHDSSWKCHPPQRATLLPRTGDGAFSLLPECHR